MLPDVFCCRSGYRQSTEFLTTDSESLFPDGSGHIFLSRENPSRKRRYGSKRQKPVSGTAQDGARQKLKSLLSESFDRVKKAFVNSSVVEPELQGAETFGQSRNVGSFGSGSGSA
jgi:hypothetical protein